MKRIFIVLLSLALLLACVPTPEEEVVINKADGVLEQIIHPATVPPATDATLPTEGVHTPDGTDALSDAMRMHEYAWNESFSVAAAMDRLDVFVDATVQVPESGTAPVYRIGFAAPDREQLEPLLRLFLGDGTIYTADRTKTKAFYKAQMERYAAEKEREPDEAVQQQWQSLLERTAKDYADAPEAQPPVAWDGTADGGVDLMAENGDGTYRYLKATDQRISFADAPDTTTYIRSEPIGRTVETDAEADALRVCQNVLNKLGIDAVFAGIRSTKDALRAFGSRIEDGYAVWFDPLYGGLPVTDERRFEGFDEAIAAAGGSAEPAHTVHYEQETIGMVVIGDHIESFLYTGPSRVLATENEAAALLPFSRIQELFQSSIGKVMFVNKGEPMKLSVHTVRLTMQRVPIENNLTEFYLLPVWEFLASVDSGHPPIDEYLQTVCVLRLNALDGSIMP